MSLFSFPSKERLKSNTRISQLFLHGDVVKKYPILIKYQFIDAPEGVSIQSLFSVPKRKIRKAVDRNLVRRRIKESFRLNKARFLPELKIPEDKHLSIAFIYTGNEIMEYHVIDKALQQCLKKLTQSINGISG